MARVQVFSAALLVYSDAVEQLTLTLAQNGKRTDADLNDL